MTFIARLWRILWHAPRHPSTPLHGVLVIGALPRAR
jgi:hypothetical protein